MMHVRVIQADTRTDLTSQKMGVEPGRGDLTTRSSSLGGLHVITYRATLDVPGELGSFTARLLLAEWGRRAPRAAAGR